MLLHGTAIALSAFLLFLVQPIVAKQILPWFGGSAAVWTTCMVFFQTALLAGYAYSDWLARRFSPRVQARVHAMLVLASLAWLPITVSDAFAPADASNPIGRIVLLLVATIGMPYLMLSTTGPLVQAWFAREHTGGRVYRLYALSNVASMLALLAYPPLIEPFTSGAQQSEGWSIGYGAFALLALSAAWRAGRAGDRTGAPQPAASAPLASGRTTPPSVRAQAGWLLLSALGSVLLLAVTTHITQNVASIPFLWVLPLSLYLLSFILCFDGQGWYRPRPFAILAGLTIVAMIAGLSWTLDADTWRPKRGLMPIAAAVPLHACGLFVLCMLCHGELVARKPAPDHLTRFYLMVSLGGAIGGLFTGVAAPLLFSWHWELPIALALLAGTLIFVATDRWRPAAAVVFCLSLLGCADYVAFVRHDAVEFARNFYGALRVKRSGEPGSPNARQVLMHGTITHGDQYLSPARAREPTTYYGESAGIGRAIAALRAGAAERPLRIGVVGLGAGTLAAYGRPGDSLRVYELDPNVLDLARRRFTYLRDSQAAIAIPLGDARLVLAREPPQRFDLLVIDAFSSDAIPVHLLTREAVQVYRRHLADDGVLALHISNRYLDLSGVARHLADAIGWTAVRVHDAPAAGAGLYPSDWVLVSATPSLIDRLRAGGGTPIAPWPGLRPWTDDYNNLFGVLK